LLIPAGIFNAHDDFQTYVTRPFRMVQTGSINGGPFDPLGVDSFGSQSFFHGFFLGDGSVGLLNGFDAIACFALCLLLSAELSLRWRLPWWLGTAAVLCLACFNPQYVNISPLYSGVAGVMAVTMAGAFLARAACAKTLFQLRPAAITFGLAVAWLATLKVTFNAYAAIFSCVLLLLILAGSHRRAAVIKAGMTSLLTAALCILPWMLIPLPGLFNAWHAGEIAGAAILHGDSGIAGSDLRLLFSPEGLYYGDTPLSYAMVAVLAWAYFQHWRRHPLFLSCVDGWIFLRDPGVFPRSIKNRYTGWVMVVSTRCAGPAGYYCHLHRLLPSAPGNRSA
jgi:hypothetical protein